MVSTIIISLSLATHNKLATYTLIVHMVDIVDHKYTMVMDDVLVDNLFDWDLFFDL